MKRQGQLPVVVLITFSSLVGGSETVAEPEGNIFTLPPETDNQIPRFTPASRPKRRLAGMMDDGIPNPALLGAIPSLTPQQRNQVVKAYRQALDGVKPLTDQLKALRQRQNQNRTRPDAAARRPVRPEMTEPVARVNGLEPERGERAPVYGEETARAAFAFMDEDSRQQALRLFQTIRKRRLAAWNQVRSMLSAGQLEELELMRRGQLVGDSLKDAPGKPLDAGSSNQIKTSSGKQSKAGSNNQLEADTGTMTSESVEKPSAGNMQQK